MKLVTNNLDPIEDSVEPIAELLMDHSHLSPQQAEAAARFILESLRTADDFTAERD